jgi:3-methyladenine DNA glycosylase AlkD
MTSAVVILAELENLADPQRAADMAHFKVGGAVVHGIPIPELRRIARQTGRDHLLAQELWDSGIHEARILASMVDDPRQVTVDQMERWVADFDSWDICDQCCGNLFDRTPYAWDKAIEWSGRPEEFVRRAGFALMAYLAVHAKKAPDEQFLPFLAEVERRAGDGRNFVKKAVNWALRQIGKRNLALNQPAVALAQKLAASQDPTERWVGKDALRELAGDQVQRKLKNKV